MPNTTRMSWPYPARLEEPYFEAMEAFFNAADASSYASREDRHILLQGGGSITWDATSGVLAWSADLEILAAITGFQWILQAPGQVTLEDGQLFYTNLVRAPTVNRSVTPFVSGQAPNTDSAFLIGVRRGTQVWFRNGVVIGDGETLSGIGSGGGTDPNAIHTNVAAEISALSLVTVDGADHIVIEDASDGDNKKRILASDLLGGGDDTVVDQTVSTTNATPTTIATYSTLANSRSAILVGTVWGYEPATGDKVTVRFVATVDRSGGAVVTIENVEFLSWYAALGAGAWSVSFAVSSQDVLIQVTGEAAHNIEWRAKVGVNEHG